MAVLSRNKLLWGVLTILVVSIAVFARCFDYGMINLDDPLYLLRHADVVKFAGWSSIVAYFTDVSEAIWMPLTWISYALDYRLFGSWLGGFHIHSVLIHAVNAVLVWRLLVLLLAPIANDRQPTTNNQLCCLLAALAWAIHPLRCESVVFLASRKDVLSFFWELLALIAWVHGSSSDNVKRRIALTAWSVAFFVVGSLCKPSVMTFPLLCVLLDVFIIRRIRPLRYIAPVIYMLFLGAFASWQQTVGGATASSAGEPLWARLVISASAFGIYLRNTVLPFWLAAQCIKRWPEWPRFMIPGIVLSTLWGLFLLKRILAYWQRRRDIMTIAYLDNCPADISFRMPHDYVFAGMAWFAIAVAPMLGIASFGYHAFADRFTYIPSFGLALLMAVGLLQAARRIGATRTYLLSAVLLVSLAGVTWWQTGFWHDDVKLFSRTVEIDGDRNDIAHRNLAMHYFEVTHDLEKAKHHFEVAKRDTVGPIINVFEMYVMMLVEMDREDEIPDAMRQYEKEIIRRYGEDRAMMILRGSREIETDQQMFGNVYRAARIAAMLGKNPSVKEAREELEDMRSEQEQSPIWQYLMWRCLSLAGDKKAADEMLKLLQDPTTKTDYTQFRFLRY